MALVHCHDANVAARAAELVRKAILIGPKPPKSSPLIIEWISR